MAGFSTEYAIIRHPWGRRPAGVSREALWRSVRLMKIKVPVLSVEYRALQASIPIGRPRCHRYVGGACHRPPALAERASAPAAAANNATCARSTNRSKKVMRRFCKNVALVAVLSGVVGFSTPSRAANGQVSVVFTKGGFIVGVGGGEGVLTLRGKRYPFTVSGMSVGFTIGASTTKLVGRALNVSSPASIEGTYSAIGAGGAVGAGAGGVQLQNANGVILQLSGPKVGAEVSAAVGGVTVRLK